MGKKTTFVRHYPAELKSSAGFFIRARVLLSVSGTVDSETGMVLNLVEFDKRAAILISEMQTQSFPSWQSAMSFLESRWPALQDSMITGTPLLALRARGVIYESRQVSRGHWLRHWQVRRWIRPLKGTGFLQLRVWQMGSLAEAQRNLRQLANDLNQSSLQTPSEWVQRLQENFESLGSGGKDFRAPAGVAVRDRVTGRLFRWRANRPG